MLTDNELEELFTLFDVKCKGISLKDELPKGNKKKIQSGFYIYNLDSRKSPVQQNSLGTHWTCSVGNDTNVFYFDSYAVVPPVEIAKFMKKRYGKFAYNNYIIQDLDSNLCGFYCLGLALFVKENQNTYSNLLQCCNEYINLFGDHAKANDKILRKYLNDIARKKNILAKATRLLSKMDK